MPFDRPFPPNAGMYPQDPWAEEERRRAMLAAQQGPAMGQPPIAAPAPRNGPNLAGSTGPGALDPSVRRAYQQREAEREKMSAALAQNAPEDKPLWQNAIGGLPILAAGIASGFLPMAAAFAIGNTLGRDREEKEAVRQYGIDQASANYGMAGERLDEAMGLFDPATRRQGTANMRPQKVRGPDGRNYWASFDPSTGKWEVSDILVGGADDGVIDRYNAALDQGLIPPGTSLKEFVARYDNLPSAVISRNEAVVDPNQTAGEQALSAAGERGKIQEQEFAKYRAARDELVTQFLPDLDEAAYSAEEMLYKIRSGEAKSLPVLGRMLANWLESYSATMEYGAGEALSNLSRVNLAPVTEKELEFIQKMAADAAAGREVNIGRLTRLLEKLSRHRDRLVREADYFEGKLGIDEDSRFSTSYDRPRFQPPGGGSVAPANETPEERLNRLLEESP